MNAKGVSGVEFVIAVTFFLIAFWYVFVEASEMFTDKPIQEDVKQPIVQLYSGYLIKNPGSPADWEDSPSDFGLAYYRNGRVHRNVLDNLKLEYANDTDCSALNPQMFKGIDFGFRVTSQSGIWACNSPPRKAVLLKRFVYIHFDGKSYKPGVLEAWAT